MTYSLKKFIEIESQRINIDKWCEGEKINGDPGIEFIRKWIENNAGLFRMKFEKSKCKDCKKLDECGYKVLEKCEEFIKLD